jgi:hypothetical protein
MSSRGYAQIARTFSIHFKQWSAAHECSRSRGWRRPTRLELAFYTPAVHQLGGVRREGLTNG